MNDIDQKAFVKTTLDTYKNENLEKVLEVSEQRTRQFKSFTNNDNRFVLVTAWSVAIIVLFCIIPLLITGVLTKGATLYDQSIYWVAMLLSSGMIIFKTYIL